MMCKSLIFTSFSILSNKSSMMFKINFVIVCSSGIPKQ